MLHNHTATKLWFLVLILGLTAGQAAIAGPAKADIPQVHLLKVPDGGIQPQLALDRNGTLHLIYYIDGDVYYQRSTDYGKTFSDRIQVNSQAGAAVAAGTIRGPQIAVGANGRVHVAWNGSSKALPKGPLNPEMDPKSPYNGTPRLYTRLDDSGKAFEPERNLMTRTFALDGGGSLAADQHGNVYVVWHAGSLDYPRGEGGRQVWLARSKDGGATFSQETHVNPDPTGACGCCGMRAFTAADGTLYALYRSATDVVHRDIYLLTSKDHGSTFTSQKVHPWNIGACPMSSMSFTQNTESSLLAGWETEGKVFWSRIDASNQKVSEPQPAPAASEKQKYPVLALNEEGSVLLVWAEGTGWQKGGALAWQVFDASGQPEGPKGFLADGVPASSFGAAFARPDGDFVVIH